MKFKIFMALVSLLILLPSVALAQGGWITLPAQAFIAGDSDYQWQIIINAGTENFLIPRGTGYTTFVAPVVFPPEADGLSVRQINATVRDNSGHEQIIVYLYRMNRYSGVPQLVFSVSSTIIGIPGTTVLTDTGGGYRLINSHKYAWFVMVYFSGEPVFAQDLALCAVRIQYQ